MAANPEVEQEEAEDWLTTYADAVTLLMAFFVLLVSFSKIDIPMFDAVMAGIRDKMSMGEATDSVTEMKQNLEDVVYSMQADQVVSVEQDESGLVLNLSSGAFYEPASAILRKEAIPVLTRIIQVIAAPEYRFFNINVEGHTDDDPIATRMFPSNWELSSARAAGVVRLFVEQGLEMQRMMASGLAESRPKVPNRVRKTGEPIPDNMEINRRVVVRMARMTKAEQGWFLRQVDPENYVTEEDTAAQAGGKPEGVEGERSGMEKGQATAPAQ